MVSKINHIGIAVNSLEAAIPFYRDVLNLEFLGIETIAEQKVKAAIFKIGEVKIELLEPSSPDSPLSKHIEKRGEGIHHIAYETDDVSASLYTFESKGIELIDQKPKDGVHGMKIVFLHPKSTGKVLTEICSKVP
ncbi:MAG: methylmalonyl-CoA epimerase [Spirochaetales bacterium]|nr:MAG: methylmalonyl-CoA epimerase [Spirochaetales bacterium]